MAKTIGKTNGSSKVRFIMLEADSDLTDISQAITQALQSPQPLARQPVAITAHSTVLRPNAAAPQEDEGVMETEAEESLDSESAAATKPRATRKLPRPNVLSD